MDARKRGVDVQILVDDRGNRGKASLSAMNLVAGAGIPMRVISTYAIHHDKYIVVDGKHTETGRKVAVKIIAAGLLSNDMALARFKLTAAT